MNCRLPRWFTAAGRWASLDQGRSLAISAEAHNASFVTMETNRLLRHGVGEYVVRDVTSALCHKRKRSHSSNALKVVLYQTLGW